MYDNVRKSMKIVKKALGVLGVEPADYHYYYYY